MSQYHTPVLLEESVGLLDLRPDGTYADLTFGGGGHSRRILSSLGEGGRLVCLVWGVWRVVGWLGNRLIPLLRRFPRLPVIGAHIGGYTIWQEAARQLAGRFENLWVDCSSSFFAMDVAAGRALIDAYGADRVLFGTDYPMWVPQHELARLRGMHLAPETERKILYDNAAALFGLEGEN